MFELRDRVIRSESYKHLGEESLREENNLSWETMAHSRDRKKKDLTQAAGT